MKYGIETINYWTCLPLRDPITISEWTDFEELPTMEFNNLKSAIKALKKRYINKIYTKNVRNGIETLLCYIIDENHNIIAALNYDKTVILNSIYEGVNI